MILCAGENLIDMIQNRETPEGVPEFRGIVGGSPYNCARALGRLSAPAGYITPIATDPMGERLAAALEADHVALLGGRSPRPTSMALVALEDGQPRYQFYREGVADRDVTLDGLRAALPEGAQALHLGSIALMHGPDADALASLVEEARAKGLVISVDPNIRPALPGADDPAYRARLERVFAMADLIKLSDEDLGWWAPGADLEDAAGALFASAGPALLLMTRGAEGAIALHRNGRVDCPAVAITDLVDTVGAGDTFMAATLQGLHATGALGRAELGALSPEQIARLITRAARAAAINCQRAGCNPPTLAELDSTT